MAGFIPQFDLLVVNLQSMSREEIRTMHNTLLLRNIFLVMKRGWDDEFFRAHAREMVIFASENIPEELLFLLFDLTLQYIQQVSQLNERIFMETMTTLPRKYEKRGKSTYQQIVEAAIQKGKGEGRQEGRQEGLQEGRQEERALLTKKLLMAFPDLTDLQVAQSLDMPVEWVQQCRAELQAANN